MLSILKIHFLGVFVCSSCRLCEPVSSFFSIVSTSNVMLLSFRMSSGNKSFKGHIEAIAEESMKPYYVVFFKR